MNTKTDKILVLKKQKTCRFKDVYNKALLNGTLTTQNPKHCTHKV